MTEENSGGAELAHSIDNFAAKQRDSIPKQASKDFGRGKASHETWEENETE